jgi:mannose-1-phosphate guanylyltransferase
LKALILAGGFGTRLRPLSCTRPKILFPIVNKPLLQWTFERLAKNNVRQAILAVNYQTEVAIKQSRIPRSGIHVTYSRDPLRRPLGTGGPIKKAEKRIGSEAPFLALNGDVFADVNYAEILKLHEQKDAVATLALCKVKDPSRYGVTELGENNLIKRFIEKPSTGSIDLINAGVYVLSPEIFRYIPEGRAVSLEREVFTKLAEEHALYGYLFNGLWMDIGKPKDYLEVNQRLISSSVNLQHRKTKKNVRIKEPVALDRGVSVGEKSVLGPNATLGRNVIIGNDVHIRDSVIFPRAVVCDFSSITGAIIGEGAVIGKNVRLGEGCIIGDHVKIKDNVSLAQRVSVCPAEEVSGRESPSKCVY